MTSTLAARRGIVDVCRRLYERGLIAGQDGNVSVRIASDRVIVTPAGLSKVDVRSADLVELTVGGEKRSGTRAPSSEVAVHLRIYQLRPDVSAVVHAHPPTATGFAVAGEGFERPILPELAYQLGPVPLVPYATPGTTALADALAPYVADHDVMLLANHGAVTVGPTLVLAHQRMESLEHAARIVLAARLVGRVNELTPAQAAELVAARARSRSTQSAPERVARRRRRREE